MKAWRVLLGLLLLCSALSSLAADFKAFRSGSLAAIEKAHHGKPMILTFWSVDCAYCDKDLMLLGEVVRQHPHITLVTVCTDDPEIAVNAKAMLSSLKLPEHQAWLFAEPDVERLRYQIDKRWYGELPRTYFYDAQHKVKAVSGKPEKAWLEDWLKSLSAKP
jgi:thiol-disulfide isomerase/thioredoxin